MHREMCRTTTDRDCRHGGRGCCRACPYRKGGALYQSPAEQHEGLVRSWYHAVLFGAAIYEVPTVSCGRALQSTVRERVKFRYRLVARRLTPAQKLTIEQMRHAAPNDAAAAAHCSTDDVLLWLLPGQATTEPPFYALPLEMRA